MSDIKSGEYNIFDDRYTVVIGKRGKVTIISNVGNGKEMRLYGRVKDSLRYVNLTTVKSTPPKSYRLSDLVSLALCEVDTIEPITEEEINDILDKVKPPSLLNDPCIIESLPTELNNYNNVVYVEELETYTRYYSKRTFNKVSNGFMKYNYSVNTYCKDTHNVTNSKTGVFTDHSTIHISNINALSNEDRLLIIERLQKGYNEE